MRYVFLLAVILISSISQADMVSVNITSTFTAAGMWFPSNCAGCTQSFNVQFQYDPSLVSSLSIDPPSNAYGLSIQSSGFLGSFSSSGTIYSDIPPHMALVNQWGDLIDVDFNPTGVTGLSLWGCVSSACTGGFGLPPINGLSIRPTDEHVIVPEPSSVLLLGMGCLILVRRRFLTKALPL
jgi:hypothetical protein